MTQEAWDGAVRALDELSLVQTGAYGVMRAGEKGYMCVRHVWEDGGVIVAAAQAVVRTVPFVGKRVVWINRAPMLRRADAPDAPALRRQCLDDLRTYWTTERGAFLCVSPPWNASLVAKTPLVDAPWRALTTDGWSSAILDLSEPIDTIRRRLDKRWRNSLANAQRQSFRVEHGDDASLLKQLLADYALCLRAPSFQSSVTPERIRAWHNAMTMGAKGRVFWAHENGRSLGSVWMIPYGRTVEYVVGAVGAEGRRVNAGQRLLYEAVCWAQHKEFQRLDIGGCHPTRTPEGIRAFKSGLGAIPYQWGGTWSAGRSLTDRAMHALIKRRLERL